MNDWSWLLGGVAATLSCAVSERTLHGSRLVRPGTWLYALAMLVWDFGGGVLLVFMSAKTHHVGYIESIGAGGTIPAVLRSNTVVATMSGPVPSAINFFGTVHVHLAEALDRALARSRTTWRRRTAEDAIHLNLQPKAIEKWLTEEIAMLKKLPDKAKAERVGEVLAISIYKTRNDKIHGYFDLIDRWQLGRNANELFPPTQVRLRARGRGGVSSRRRK